MVKKPKIAGSRALSRLRSGKPLVDVRLCSRGLDLLHGLIEVLLLHLVLAELCLFFGLFSQDALPDGQHHRFIDHCRQVGARVLVRLLGQILQADICCQRLLGRVYLQDLQTGLLIRQADLDEPIEPSWPKQCRIDDVRSVGGRYHYHAVQ